MLLDRSTALMLCTRCSVPNLDDATYCAGCGEALCPPLPYIREVRQRTGGDRGFKRFIGQNDTVRRLKAFADLHAVTRQPIGHVLLLGADGIGKRALTHALAEEYNKRLTELEAEEVETPESLASVLASAGRVGIVLLAGLGQLRRGLVGSLISGLEDFQIPLKTGRPPLVRSFTARLDAFTCVATVEKQSDIRADLLKGFALRLEFEEYSEPELRRLARTLAWASGFSVDHSAAALVAKAAAGSPSEVQELIRHIAMTGENSVNETSAARTLSILGKRAEVTPDVGVTTSFERLSGIEFETMVTSLLQGMGLRAVMTKASGDGGIDIEAVSDTPITGGRFLVQCKRYAPGLQVGSPEIPWVLWSRRGGPESDQRNLHHHLRVYATSAPVCSECWTRIDRRQTA